ncbi:MAG: protease SohB [Gammaproteobacteria bacterium]|nr:protease SohB [Gammaproteobacteria bacterium]
MTDFLFDYGLFLAKTLTILAAIVVAAAAIANLVHQIRAHVGDRLEIKNVNERLRDMAHVLNHSLLTPDELKHLDKERRKKDKEEARARKHGQLAPRPRMFVLDFHGDLHASAVASLREEISAVLQVAQPKDEVMVRLESEGGLVHGYGLAASQLARIREKKIKLTVAVDKVAASGGYLMACVADRILAAPFAIVGSIGVIAQLPNFNRLLKKHDVDFELHTAGEYKRTLTLFGENTEAARKKFREELEDTHALFKSFVADNRPQVPIEQVATGEHWFGTRALAHKLVDELKTSDDYLLERAGDADIHEVHFKRHRPLSERLAGGLASLQTRWRALPPAWPRLRGLPEVPVDKL